MGRIASEESYLLSDINEITASQNLLVRLHASFMITAWVLCASTGIMMAKYFKTTWVHVQLGGASLWFVVCNKFHNCICKSHMSLSYDRFIELV